MRLQQGFASAAFFVTFLCSQCGTGAALSKSAVTPAELAQADARAATVGYRLARQGAKVCPRVEWLLGFDIGMLSQYRPQDRDHARALGLSDWPTVTAVAATGMAHRSGLRPGDIIRAIEEVRTARSELDAPANFAEAEQVRMQLAGAASDGVLILQVQRGHENHDISIGLERGCSMRLIVEVGGVTGTKSDRTTIKLTTGLIAFTTDDDELAVLAGHELAHIVLNERVRGSHAKNREDQADALGLVFAVRAGYAAAAGPRFWARFAAADTLGFLRAADHRSSRQRAELLSAVASRIIMIGPDAVLTEILSATESRKR